MSRPRPDLPFDQGGHLPRGINQVRNTTGQPEPLGVWRSRERARFEQEAEDWERTTTRFLRWISLWVVSLGVLVVASFLFLGWAIYTLVQWVVGA